VDEARHRLTRVGPNRVGKHAEIPLWRLLLAQFRSMVLLLLLAAVVIAGSLGERVEALAILAALLLNAAIGFLTEWRARASLAKLRALTAPQALVRRGGRVTRIPAVEVAPGDLLVLEAGAHVPAETTLTRSCGRRKPTGRTSSPSRPPGEAV
jgi:Ca2+-transporting ATPase